MLAKFIVFISTGFPRSTEVLGAVEEVCGWRNVQQLHSMETLNEALRDPLRHASVFVLLLGAAEEANRLAKMRELIANRRVILAVSSQNEGLLRQAWEVRPRVLLTPPIVLEELSAVARKMLFNRIPSVDRRETGTQEP